MELKNKNSNDISGGIELPPLTPIDTTKPVEPTQDVTQNSLLQQTVNQKQEIDEDMKKKLKEIRYKIYIFFMLLIGLLSFPFFSKTLTNYESLKTQITDSKTKMEQAKSELTKVQGQIKLVKDTRAIISGSGDAGYSNQQIDHIKNCIFSDQDDLSKCKDAPEDVKSSTSFLAQNKDILRNIALLKGVEKNATGSIANFDQKKVLQGLNEEIIGKDIMGSAKLTTFGEKVLVKFSDDSNETTKLYRVPISLNVELEYKQLSDILKKIEKTIQYKNKDVANLYDVKTVNYDIGKAKTSDSGQGEISQETTLNIDTYFYEN